MDIDDIRRANIRLLQQSAGSARLAADKVGMTYAQFVNYRDGAKEAKTGKVRGMRKETAWRIEDAFNMPRGWLDQPHGSEASASADDAALEVCRAKLKQAQKLEVLTDLQWKSTRLHVVAGPTYYSMPFHAKEGFADTVNCFAMAGKSGCLSFDILHWRTGRASDHYSGCKLTPK